MLNKKLFQSIIVIAFLLLITSNSFAHVWHVKKDETGDYQVIQEAVDAAASGDTIQIGPGRYTEYVADASRELAWYVLSEDKDLTFLGSTEGETIIGHDSSPLPYYWTMFGIEGSLGVNYSEYRNISFEVFRGTGLVVSSGSLLAEDCVFRNSIGGTTTVLSQVGYIRRCQFSNIGHGGITNFSPGTDILIEQCTFTDCRSSVNNQGACESIAVLDCIISGGRAGVSFVNGASGLVRNCTISGQDMWGIVMNGAGTVEIEDNHITMDHEWGESVGLGLYWRPGNITARRNVITASGGNKVIFACPPGFVTDIRNNHFLLADEESFFVVGWLNPSHTGGPVHVDLTGNWWGTTDPEEIDERIIDVHGLEDPNYIIDYLPILTGPVPTKRTSMGGMRASYR